MMPQPADDPVDDHEGAIDEFHHDRALDVSRRAVLAGAGSLGAASVAGCLGSSPSDGETTTADEERARELAVRFAPTLYFDAFEPWLPTDPRRYESERDGEPIVDGFDAFDGYTTDAAESEDPPAPTLFYHVVTYDDSSLAVVQYWYYAAFDQFTTNFHWHDWEVLHVFVDTETDEPQLYVASSHSGRVPNNEFLDPDPDRTPRILSELGSHSSALSINDVADRFQRLPIDGTFADITNGVLEGLNAVAAIPIAYGLPRDEGARLPYLVPELDGEPIYEHDRLPAVSRETLIDESVTIRSLSALSAPPGDLPARATGVVFEPAARDPAESEVAYELVPSTAVEHLTAFTGPQLSFEFAVPQFAEDTIAGHITTTGVPWTQPRYDNPAADITDPTHRAAMADRYDVIDNPGLLATLAFSVREAVRSEDAPEGEGLTTRGLPIEASVLLESDPEAVPTFGGIGLLRDVPAGEHRLTVNAAGVEPYSEPVTVEEPDSGGSGDANGASDGPTPTLAGVEGALAVVAREESFKLELDAAASERELTAFAVEDDFAGRLYDVSLSGSDAVYLHRGGAYTAEYRDEDGAVGVTRINPTDGETVRIENPRTGIAPLATFVADLTEETSAAVSRVIEETNGDDVFEETTREEEFEETENVESGTIEESNGTTSNETSETASNETLADGDVVEGETDTATNDSPEPIEDTVGGSIRSLLALRSALDAAGEAARTAAERADADDPAGADAALENVAANLERAEARREEAGDALPDAVDAAATRRIETAQRRTEQAREAAAARL